MLFLKQIWNYLDALIALITKQQLLGINIFYNYINFLLYCLCLKKTHIWYPSACWGENIR